MQTKLKIVLFVFILAFIGCKEEKTKPKVIYDAKKENPIKNDSTLISVADLPIHLNGTKYLLYPIGEIRVLNEGKYASSRGSESISFSISNNDSNEITGFFDNLKFQHIDSTKTRTLATNKIQFQTVTFLKNIADKTNKQILVYTLADSDTNQDGIVNKDDIKSLYISKIDGFGFKKLSNEFHELIDWNIVEIQNKLYFRSIEDINKNGAFDKNDKIHYHFVNLLDKDWKVESLNF